MQVKVIYFGMMADAAGNSQEDWELEPSTTVGQLRSLLGDKYAAFKDLHFKIAVNQDIAGEEVVMEEGVEVALLPPYAGG